MNIFKYTMFLICIVILIRTDWAFGDNVDIPLSFDNTPSTLQISPDGRYLIFSLDTNIYLFDRTDRSLRQIIHTPSGQPANGKSYNFSFTNDNRYILFTSKASNLELIDNDSTPDLFLHDQNTGLTEMLFDNDAFGIKGHISGDGKWVVFYSASSNLVENDTNSTHDVFLIETATKHIQRLSLSYLSLQANGASIHPHISADGRYVCFSSEADNLVPNDNNEKSDIFIRYIGQESISGPLISRASIGYNDLEANGSSIRCSLSETGRFLVFQTTATNLDNNYYQYIKTFIRDNENRTLSRVDKTFRSQDPFQYAYEYQLSQNGKFVTYISPRYYGDVYIYDKPQLLLKKVIEQPNQYSPVINANGRYIAVVQNTLPLVNYNIVIWSRNRSPIVKIKNILGSIPIAKWIVMTGRVNDPDGDRISKYRWEIIESTEGSRLEFRNLDRPKTFIRALTKGIFRIQLRATDSPPFLDTQPLQSSKEILVRAGSNLPPIVNAGPDIKLTSPPPIFTKFILHGSASDPDNDKLLYKWFIESKPGNTSVLFDRIDRLETGVRIIPMLEGEYKFGLTATENVKGVRYHSTDYMSIIFKKTK